MRNETTPPPGTTVRRLSAQEAMARTLAAYPLTLAHLARLETRSEAPEDGHQPVRD